MFKGSRIGKQVTDSPLPFMCWLKPVMLRVNVERMVNYLVRETLPDTKRNP